MWSSRATALLVLLGCCAPGWATIAPVSGQTKIICCSNPNVVSLPSATTTGDLLVVSGAKLSQPTTTITSITGGGVTTWLKAKTSNAFGDVEVWYGVVAAGSSTAITVTFSTSTGLNEAIVTEFSTSIPGTWTLDQSAVNTSSASPLSSGSITTTVATELVYASAMRNGWSTTASGFTSLTTTSDFTQAAYLIVTSTGTYSTSWTYPSGNAEAVIASFYVAAGGAPTRTLMGVGQ